ncbi:hypothetical protein BaRGS_00018286 [Batillaria attramentaria]|uniref:Uncharacterized protein n=1 Tax=Batillaria attramentaria TaxID=370345 RepID=A0ABD0KTJ5_9CAEN
MARGVGQRRGTVSICHQTSAGHLHDNYATVQGHPPHLDRRLWPQPRLHTDVAWPVAIGNQHSVPPTPCLSLYHYYYYYCRRSLCHCGLAVVRSTSKQAEEYFRFCGPRKCLTFSFYCARCLTQSVTETLDFAFTELICLLLLYGLLPLVCVETFALSDVSYSDLDASINRKARKGTFLCRPRSHRSSGEAFLCNSDGILFSFQIRLAYCAQAQKGRSHDPDKLLDQARGSTAHLTLTSVFRWILALLGLATLLKVTVRWRLGSFKDRKTRQSNFTQSSGTQDCLSRFKPFSNTRLTRPVEFAVDSNRRTSVIANRGSYPSFGESSRLSLTTNHRFTGEPADSNPNRARDSETGGAPSRPAMGKNLLSSVGAKLSQLKVMCGLSVDSAAKEEKAVAAVRRDPVPASRFLHVCKQRKFDKQLATEFKVSKTDVVLVLLVESLKSATRDEREDMLPTALSGPAHRMHVCL